MDFSTDRAKLVAGVAVLAGTAVVTSWAQGLGPSSSGSLAELTAEVRQLRVVIQDAGRNQSQMQALGIALTAQQSRLTQVGARLDAAQQELEKAQVNTRQLMTVVTNAQNATLPQNVSAAERAEHAEMLKMMRGQVDDAQAAENAIRVRINDLTAAFRAEEARWLELVAKLDEVVKR